MKKIYTNLFLVTALFAFTTLNAQWSSIATVNQVVSDLKTFNGKLFFGGPFSTVNSGAGYVSAFWDGSSVTNQTIPIAGGGINRFEVFNGEFYATGAMLFVPNTGLAKWNGSTWINASSFLTSQWGIFADGNDLYVGDNAGIVNKKTGTGNFSPLSTSFVPPGPVNAFTKYNGEIIAAGTFSLFGGTYLNNIARWSGGTWLALGTGVNNTIRCLAVYNGDLYAGGAFTTASGTAAKYIAKWNGSAWSDVGGSVTSTGGGIYDMVVFDNKLYVCGDFSMIGTTSANYIASWDGTTWTDMQFTGSPFVSTIEVYNFQLYAGTFDITSSQVYQLAGVLGMNEHQIADISFNPNPFMDQLQIHVNGNFKGSNMVLELYDLSGRIIFNQNIIDNYSHVNVGFLSPGSYHATIKSQENGKILFRKKLIKI